MRSLLILRPTSPLFSSPCSSLSPPPRNSSKFVKRLHFSCSSSKKQHQNTQTTLHKSPPPQSLRRLLNWNLKPDDEDPKSDDNGGEGMGLEGDTAMKGTLLAGILLVGVIGGFGAAGYIYRDQINSFLIQFSSFIEGNILILILQFLA